VTHDEFTRREEEARHLIDTFGKLSRGVQASPDFASRVMAQAEQLPVPCRGFRSWLMTGSIGPLPVGRRLVIAAACLLVILGAVPQYMTWIRAYLLGVPSGTGSQAKLQEALWKKNFACATQIDHDSANYALITSEHVTVVTWACPSGDVLVTVESPTQDVVERSVWVGLDTPERTTRLWQGVTRQAYAGTGPLYARRQADPIIAVLCQKWLPNDLVKRRIRRANGECVDQIISPRNGQVLQQKPAPCSRDC
jgi:hypothetical protein